MKRLKIVLLFLISSSFIYAHSNRNKVLFSIEQSSFDCFLAANIYVGKIECSYYSEDSSCFRLYHDSVSYFQIIKPNSITKIIETHVYNLKNRLDTNKLNECTGTDYYTIILDSTVFKYTDEGCIWDYSIEQLASKIQSIDFLGKKRSREIKFKLSDDLAEKSKGYVFDKKYPLDFYIEDFKTRYIPTNYQLRKVVKLLKSQDVLAEQIDFQYQFFGWKNNKGENIVLVNSFPVIYGVSFKPSEDIQIDCGMLYSESKQYLINLNKNQISSVVKKLNNCK